MMSERLVDEFKVATKDNERLRWYVLKKDETRYWNLELLAKCLRDRDLPAILPTKVYAYYLATVDVAIHICSFQRSAELFFLESEPEWDPADDVSDELREAVGEWILEGNAEQNSVDYADWHDTFPEALQGNEPEGPNFRFVGATSKHEPELTEERDALFEYLRGNPPCF